MTAPPPRTKSQSRALLALLVAVTAALGWILWPMFGALLWGAVIALMFTPAQRRLLRRLRRLRHLRHLRHHRSLAALLTLALATALVILPLALLASALAAELATLYQQLQSGDLDLTRHGRSVYKALPELVTGLLGRIGLANFDALQRRLTSALGQASETIAAQAFNLGQGSFEFGTLLAITLYLAFFMIRDGHQLMRVIRHALPLADDQKRLLG